MAFASRFRIAFAERADEACTAEYATLRLVVAGPPDNATALLSTPKAMTMRIAAELLGGPRKLRIFLSASAADVAAWLAATRDPPEPVFLRALELILEEFDAGGRRLAKIRRARRQGAQILKPRIKGPPK